MGSYTADSLVLLAGWAPGFGVDKQGRVVRDRAAPENVVVFLSVELVQVQVRTRLVNAVLGFRHVGDLPVVVINLGDPDVVLRT